MISDLGRALVLLAVGLAASGSVLGFVSGYRRSREGWAWTRWAATGFGVTTILANLVMVYALVTHDFSVGYVAEVGSTTTPLHITITSLWASLNGSILFWAGVLGAYTLGVTWTYRDAHREYMPYTLGVLLAVGVFFTMLVAGIANPFEPISPVPAEGPGPNPLLQNHVLMIVHPPTLYLGYVGMAVPFSMACAGLLAGRFEAGWATPLRRWTYLPWAFLSFGILLGGWWSYEVLGWGGYWAWDPVENASFLPWLTGTAFLHSAMVQQRRGVMKTWTLLLAMSTFLLTLLGTFMTRSGVFNSVHSFTQSNIGPVFLGFIAVVLVSSVLLLALRAEVLDDERKVILVPTARETAILVQNLLFTAFTFTVLLGTLYPLIAEAIDGTRLSVGEPYFNRMALPLGTALVFMMGIGPAVPWGGKVTPTLWRRLGLAAIAGLVSAGVTALSTTEPYTLLALFVCGFAAVLQLFEMADPILARRGSLPDEPIGTAIGRTVSRLRRKYGGLTVHLAIIMAVVAIALSSTFKTERDVTLEPGESAQVGDYTLTFLGAKLEKHPHKEALAATFHVAGPDGEDLGDLSPALNYYARQREPIGTPAVRSTLTNDLYLSLMQVQPQGEYASVRVMSMPAVVWLWASGPLLLLGAFFGLWPRVGGGRRKTSQAPAAGEVA